MRPTRTLLLLILFLLVPSPTDAGPGTGPRRDPIAAFGEDGSAPGPKVELRLFLLGNQGGNLATVRCRESPNIAEQSLYYAQQVAEYRRQVALAEATGLPPPLALNVGDLIFPGSLPRHLLARQPEGSEELVRLLNRIPFAGVAVGNQEFGPPREETLAFLKAARALGMPIGAANVSCAPGSGDDALCAALEPPEQPAVVERGPLRIGIISVIDPALEGRVAGSRLEGLKISDPGLLLSTLVPRLRGPGGADLVIVQFHAVGGATRKAQKLATAVPGIDLVVTNSRLDLESEDAESSADGRLGYFVTPRTHALVVGADSGSRHAVLVEARVEWREGGWRLVGFEPSSIATHELPADPETAEVLRNVAREYCRHWGSSIGGVPLAQPFSFEDLRGFVLNVMRFATGSQVAVINEAAFRNEGLFPISGTLTRADLNSTLPYSNQLVTGRVSGAVLLSLAQQQGNGLVAAGLEPGAGDKPQVNGRPIDPKLSYTLVTSSFVAEGGDRLLDPAKLQNKKQFRPRWSEEAPSTGAVVEHYIESGEYARAGRLKDALSPTLSFPDLSRKLLWNLTGSVNSSYNKVGVTNPDRGGSPAYSQSQLTVNSTDQLNLELKALARADTRNHGWDNELLVQYATARVRGGEGTQRFEETRDLVRGRSAYKLLSPKATLGDGWWAPIPFAELQAETEFDPPDEREWHKLELTGIFGTSFQLAGPLEARLGVNARRDLNQPGTQTTYGLNLGYRLARIDLANLLGKPVQFESDFEYFFNSIGADNIQELRHSDRLYFAISDRLFFTTSFSVFLYRTGEVSRLGSNAQLTVGLNFLWDRSIQSF